MNTSDSNTRPATKSMSSRTLLIAGAVVALLVLGVYFWGQFQTRSQLDAQKSGYEQRIGAVQQQLQAARRDLASTSNRNQLLLARTDLYRTAGDLDARNFGTANTRLQQAAAALGKVDASGGDLDAQKLATLRASIANTNINVATDLQQQRAQVLDFATQLDALAGSNATDKTAAQ